MIGAKVTRRRADNIAKSLPNLHLPPPPPTPPPPPPPAPPVKYWLHFPLSSLAWWTSLNLFPLLGFFLFQFFLTSVTLGKGRYKLDLGSKKVEKRKSMKGAEEK